MRFYKQWELDMVFNKFVRKGPTQNPKIPIFVLEIFLGSRKIY